MKSFFIISIPISFLISIGVTELLGLDFKETILDLIIALIFQPLIFILFYELYKNRYRFLIDESHRFKLSDQELYSKYNKENSLRVNGHQIPSTLLHSPNQQTFLKDIDYLFEKFSFNPRPLLDFHFDKIKQFNNYYTHNAHTLRLVEIKDDKKN